MLQDLHSHTYYSFCGKDSPEAIVEAAIAGGLELFGITDHNHGIGNARYNVFAYPEEKGVTHDYERTLRRYFDHINLIKEKYADRICVLRGIEVCALGAPHYNRHALPDNADISYFDYCLIEHMDNPNTIVPDLFLYVKRCGCPIVGIAHTDMFAYLKQRNLSPYDYFSRMAENNIFWEMNVSYDSIHNYRVHPYMLDFFADEEKQEIIRRSGVRVSIGFDGHRVEDYLPERIKEYCNKLTALRIKMPFED